MSTEEPPLLTLKWSIQRGLVAEVTATWAAVTCGLRERQILIVLFVWGPVTAEDRERISAVGTQVIADFPQGYMVEQQCRSLDAHPLAMQDFWAYMRAEAEPLLVRDDSANSK